MIFCTNSTADNAGWQRARGLNRFRNDASFLHSLYRNKLLSTMPAVAAYEQASVLTTCVLAATNHPLFFKLTSGAWIGWPLKRFRHFMF
jgi:hypothetical protein